jgi:hypothetical protein
LIKEFGKINKLIAMGVEGLEVYYPEHHPDQVIELARLAEQHHLLMSGGSDFHGSGSSESRNQLGFAGIDKVMMERIWEYHRAKPQNIFR